MAKEQDVIQLPFKITEFNQDMVIALDRNFKEIERQLSSLQLNMKQISGGSVKDVVNTISKIKDSAGNSMGVDSDCTGLWHFDNSLNNHKGIAAIASIPAVFETGKFGKSLVLDDTQIIKVATADTLFPEEGTVTLYASNLSTAANGSVILDIPNSDENQGILCGISADAGHEGEVFISDSDKAFRYSETTQADFNSGTLTDVTATSAGDLELVTSTIGKALQLDGIDDYVDISGIWSKFTTNNTPFTLEAWVKPNNTANQHDVIDIGDGGDAKSGFRLIIYNSQINAQLMDGSNRYNASGGTVKTGVVQHVAATYDGVNTKVYLDGAKVAENATGSWVKSSVAYIGKQAGNLAFLNGIVDDVRIWTIARTQAEIQNSINRELNGNETGLVAYWKFNESSGSISEDSTANNIDGTICGATRVDGLVTVYKPSGSREKVIDLSEVSDVLGSTVAWDKSDAIQAGTFTRASVAYKKDGTQVASGVPRYEAGKFGNGVHIEEATNNLLTANQSSVDTDTTGFAINGAGTVISRDTTQHWNGNASLKVVTPANTGYGFMTSPYTTITGGQPYTASVYLKGSGIVALQIQERNSGTYLRTTVSTWITLTNEWQRLSVTATIGTDANQTMIYVYQTTATINTFWADGLQIEQKAYATSWQIGGTPRVADSLYYTLPSALPSEWFISGVWVPDQGSAVDKILNSRLVMPYYDANNRFMLDYAPSTDTFILYKIYGGSSITLNSAVVSFSAGDTISFAVAQLTQAHGDLAAGMHMWCRINSGTVVHVSNIDVNLPTAPTKAYIGCHTPAGNLANGVIDAVKLVDIQAAAASGTTISEAWAESFLTATTAPTADPATILLANFDNTLDAITGTAKIETALSTDGGSTYGTYQICTSGQAIPGIPPGIDLSNARIKLKESLNTYGYATPQLHSLNFSIKEKDATTVYGPSKSTLNAWDMLSLAWKSDRLSLVLNGVEGCFAENPGLPAVIGPHAYIGCGRNGDKRIAVPIDELRIDKKYKEANIRRAWYSLQSPFYTSDDLAQLPGYIKPETDGWKVYDAEGNLRGTYGSWIDGDGVRQYGLRLVNGVVETNVLIVNKTAGGIIDMINGYGDGSDGDLTAGTTISVPAHDQQVVIKQYNSINIPAGQTLTVDKRICGLFLLCRGDVTINGTIDLDGKGAKYYSGAAPAVSGTILSAIPSGGNGGTGGRGGRGARGSSNYTFYQGEPGAGSGGTSGKWYAGGWGGAGGGGAGSTILWKSMGEYIPGSGGNAGQSIDMNPLGTGGYGGSPDGGNGGVGGNLCGGGGGAGNAGHGGGGGAGFIGGSPGEASYEDSGAHVAVAGTSGMGIGGGTLVIVAKGTITIGSTGQIKCNGLNGGNGGSGACQSYTGADWTGSGGGGGQGGGGGGSVLLAYGTALVNNGTITVNGGSGGAGGQRGLCSADQSDLGYEGYTGSSGTAGTVGGIATKKLT